MVIWMQVSTDKYKLPEVVADSIHELACKCGVKESSIYISMCRSRQGKMPEKYCRVTIPDEEIENLIWGIECGRDNGLNIDDESYKKYLAMCKLKEDSCASASKE